MRKFTLLIASLFIATCAMAQSLELKKELDFMSEELLEGICVFEKYAKDGKARMCVPEFIRETDEYGNTKSSYLQKLSILNNELQVEKEFTSGPLFEEFTNTTVKYEKQLEVEVSVDNTKGLEDFYSDFQFGCYDEENDDYVVLNYTQLVETFPDTLETVLPNWVRENYSNAIINGQTVYYYRWNVETEYINGESYPKSGWIYRSYNDVEYANFTYSLDDYKEVSRTTRTYNAFYNGGGLYQASIGGEGYANIGITQTLFNDDEKYEFVIPVMAEFESTYESSYENTATKYYENEEIGYKVVSEDGNELFRIIVNEDKDEDLRFSVFFVNFSGKEYFIVSSHKYVEGEYTEEKTSFYELKKNGNGTSVQKVREVRGNMNIRPTVADRNEEITITLNDEDDTERELIITGVNGQLVERRAINTGENTVKVKAAMMRSGMYNFTIQKRGEVYDNGKVIVK